MKTAKEIRKETVLKPFLQERKGILYTAKEVDAIAEEYASQFKVEEPKPEFKVGDWVMGVIDRSIIGRIIKIDKYALLLDNDMDSSIFYSTCGHLLENAIGKNCFRPATKDEIESHLKKICDEKYVGKRVKCLAFPERGIFQLGKKIKCEYFPNSDKLIVVNPMYNNVEVPAVYSKGKWAEIIPEKKKLPKTKEELEVLFGDCFDYLTDSRSNCIEDFLKDYED